MRLEIRQIDDGRGPYRWRPVIRTHSGLAAGGIHDKAEALNPSEAATVRATLGDRYEIRELDA
jgi:hypothetical protein